MIIGITAEWNPFHEGHLYMIQQLKKEYPNVPIVAVMSGSFVQRGEPALFDKWTRAKWALHHGVDIVIELPTGSVLQSADKFADAAVFLLHALGCTHIAFGAESLSEKELQVLSDWTLTAKFNEAFHQYLLQGMTYSTAIDKAISTEFPLLEKEIRKPNNLLGLRYMESARRRQFSMSFIVIKRDSNHPASATAARETLLQEGTYDFLPKDVKDDIKHLMLKGDRTSYRRYDNACLLFSRLITPKHLQESGLFSEGLENRWYKEIQENSWEKVLSAIKSKRYLYSRLKRMSATLLLSGTESPSPFSVPPLPPYARVLALKETQSKILKYAQLPIITSVARDIKKLDSLGQSLLSLDLRATDIQQYCSKNEAYRSARRDYYISPIIEK